MTGNRPDRRATGAGLLLAIMMLVAPLALTSCSSESPVFAEAEKNRWEGQLKFVFLERSIVVPFYLTGSEALLLRPSQDTEYIGVGELVEGDGINVANRMFHSASSYEVRGEISEEAVDGVGLLSIPTRIVDIKSIKLVEKGEGECTAYIGRLVPPRPGRDGFAPVLPDYAEGRKGMFVHDGRAKCTIVRQGGELFSSITSVGSINSNAEIDWARPAQVAGQPAGN